MRFVLSCIALVISACLFSGVAFAYVSPGAPRGYVSDFSGTLTPQEIATLESTLKNFHETSGGDISVAIIPTLAGDAIEDYANTLFREWGIGNKNGNLGVLLLVAKDDHALRIEVGYGYEGALTDALSSEIIRNVIVPRFKSDAYAEGISAGVGEIIATINDPNRVVPTPPETKNAWSTLLILLSVALSFLASIFARSKSWWLGGVVGAGVGYALPLFGVLFISRVVMVVGLSIAGLFFDYFVSRGYKSGMGGSGGPPWWTGGGSYGGGGGGFGGFGGGSSGGGGASGRW